MDYQVGIVGAGFGGLVAALELKRANRESFVVFERANELGGVWRDNIYPGCACDIRSHFYYIAASPKADWTSNYATQPEILDYLKDVARDHDLRRHIKFAWNVSELVFLEREGCWKVVNQTGESVRVGMVILAAGPLNRPRIPTLPGLSGFKGTFCHSSAWDPSVELAGKRVAVVGTGASAIQIVPNVAPLVSSLAVFQRTPAWIVPRGARPISGLERWLFTRLPFTRALVTSGIYWLMEVVALGFVGNRAMRTLLTGLARRKIEKEVRDPELRKKLTPGYQIGCKRILVSDDYYPAFNRDNVRLVTDDIREVTPAGIRTVDGKTYEVDHIIFATGFVVADPDNYIRVVGRGGRVLTEQWADDGMQAYLGTTVAGYPNLAFLLGPNSGPANSSAIHVIESQIAYVMQYLGELENAGPHACLDVNPEVQARYNEELQQRLAHTVWNSGCNNWYLDRNGRNTTMYPGLTSRYRRLTARLKLADYAVIRSASATRAAPGDTTAIARAPRGALRARTLSPRMD